ncbi:hypothetical protein BGX31_008598 [Mortierella sp. GBA43]|nr:hypothetical protein BGX31_008598 [Mortierella sp. GBA43]
MRAIQNSCVDSTVKCGGVPAFSSPTTSFIPVISLTLPTPLKEVTQQSRISLRVRLHFHKRFMTTMPKGPSIFDIPLIMDLIGKNLDHRDYVNCTLVNRAFYWHFTPIIWRRLQYHTVTKGRYLHQDPDQDRVKEIFGRNSRWTRDVFLQTSAQRGMTSLLSSSTRTLERLSCFVSPTLVDRNDLVIGSILDMVTNNPELQTFWLTSQIDLPQTSLQRLPEVLSVHPCLTVLKLELTWRPCHAWLQHLLQYLPLTLQDLDLEWKRLKRYTDGVPFSDENWPDKYPNMKRANFTFQMDEDKEEVVHQFLQRCPVLESLSYPTTAERQITTLIPLIQETDFPRLSSIHLGRYNQLTEVQWCQLIVAMEGRIKNFAIDFNFPSMSTHIGSMLATYWADTIESLRFPCLLNSDVQLILTQCPKLRKFDCMWIQDRGDALDDPPMAEWICQGMEVMRLMFIDGRRAGADEEDCSRREARAVGRIERAYTQLGRLTKLKELAIGWKAESTFRDRQNLDMSLESGLWRLSGLKSLELLDISNVRRINVGKPEVQWMADRSSLMSTLSWMESAAISTEKTSPIAPFKLKKFYCLHPSVSVMFEEEDDELVQYPGLEAVKRKDWVCTEMEVFELSFADMRRSRAAEPALSLQEGWCQDGIRHVYQQLGRLTKLQRLAIGWSTPKEFSGGANLDMSLQSGLEHLEGLTSLTTLDIKHVRRLHIGPEEANWMLKSWPALREIRGTKKLDNEIRSLFLERHGMTLK